MSSTIQMVDLKGQYNRLKPEIDLAIQEVLDGCIFINGPQVKDFSDAMMWDSTEDLSLLRNRVEELAETNPEFFNDLVSGEMVKYQAAVKQALDRQIISFDPAEWKFIWTSNQQPIAILNEVSGKNYVEQMAEWLQVNAEKGKQVYDKLKSLLK